MIGYLTGTVKAVRKNYIIILTDHVGYKVFVTPQALLSLEPANKVEFFIHTHVREDILALYGFPTLSELEFFELLLTVTGVGPRLALSILSIQDLPMIKSAIVNGDPSIFTKVSGVGRKIAERLIIELKEKISEDMMDGEELVEVSQKHADVLDVLLALGYSRSEARKALSEVPKDIADTEEKVRFALRSLAKQ